MTGRELVPYTPPPVPVVIVEPIRVHMIEPEPGARLISAPEAARYLHGDRPEDYGVRPVNDGRKGARQRLYDRRAIDAALDRISGIISLVKTANRSEPSPEDDAASVVKDWLS